ncbi:MAG: hypothetical protein ACJAVV_003521, partial [Alphaproteobacteria bacterium]
SKPRFSKQGLQNAYFHNKTQAVDEQLDSLYTSSMNSLKQLGYRCNGYGKNKVDANNVDVEKTKYVANNEYDSVSVALINQQIVRKLNMQIQDKGYMFKQYYAYPKNIENKVDNTSELPLSIIDSLENRGRLMNRPPFDFELMGAWQSVDNL